MEFPDLIEAGLKVGDPVDTLYGDGVVSAIFKEEEYPIRVKVDIGFIDFLTDGRYTKISTLPSLWLKSDMSWFKPPTELPEPDHMEEFTLGRKVWVRFRCNYGEWKPLIAALYTPSTPCRFWTFPELATQETATTIVPWDQVRYTRPDGAEDHER